MNFIREFLDTILISSNKRGKRNLLLSYYKVHGYSQVYGKLFSQLKKAAEILWTK